MVVASPVEHAMGVLTATLPKAVTNNAKGPPSASATLRCGTPKNARFMRVEHGGLSGFGETKSFIPVDVITRISADEAYIHHSREHVASAPRYESIAVTGALVQWFRDKVGLIGSAPEVETLARTVDDNGGIYFVPAFSGLFAPHWRGDARGVIAGLTGYVTKGHLARAVLEATAWQTREVVDAMNADSGIELSSLKADGGMTANNLLMQFLADVLGVPVVRPNVAETVSLGAAYAAGLAVGFWPDVESLRANWHKAAEWLPRMDASARDTGYRKWKKAVQRTLDWVDDDDDRPRLSIDHERRYRHR
jgi:sugar (pentulose or hexulose) kinase